MQTVLGRTTRETPEPSLPPSASPGPRGTQVPPCDRCAGPGHALPDSRPPAGTNAPSTEESRRVCSRTTYEPGTAGARHVQGRDHHRGPRRRDPRRGDGRPPGRARPPPDRARSETALRPRVRTPRDPPPRGRKGRGPRTRGTPEAARIRQGTAALIGFPGAVHGPMGRDPKAVRRLPAGGGHRGRRTAGTADVGPGLSGRRAVRGAARRALRPPRAARRRLSQPSRSRRRPWQHGAEPQGHGWGGELFDALVARHPADSGRHRPQRHQAGGTGTR